MTSIAFGFGAAFTTISCDGSGDGVTKSFSARAQSRITDPSCPTADTTVSVYAVPGRSSASRVIRTWFGFSVFPERESILILLASDCLTILSFRVSRLTCVEKLISRCVSSFVSSETSWSGGGVTTADHGGGIVPDVSARETAGIRKRAREIATTEREKSDFILENEKK